MILEKIIQDSTAFLSVIPTQTDLMRSIDKRLKIPKFNAPGTKEKTEGGKKPKLEINIPLREIALKSLLTAAER